MNSSILIYDDNDQLAKKAAKMIGCITGNTKVCGLKTLTEEQDYENLILIFNNEELAGIKKIAAQMEALKQRYHVKNTILIECGAHPQFECYFADLMDDYYFLSSVAGIEKITKGLRECYLAKTKQMPREELERKIHNFIYAHNTGALATGNNRFVRCTPVEYIYQLDTFYLITEGGLKFRALLENDYVSFSIFESYTTMDGLKGLQIMGRAQIIDSESSEYEMILEQRGYPKGCIKNIPIDLYVIKIIPETYEYLSSDLKKRGFSSKQVITENENHYH